MSNFPCSLWCASFWPTFQVNIASNGEIEVGEINLQEMDPEEIRVSVVQSECFVTFRKWLQNRGIRELLMAKTTDRRSCSVQLFSFWGTLASKQCCWCEVFVTFRLNWNGYTHNYTLSKQRTWEKTTRTFPKDGEVASRHTGDSHCRYTLRAALSKCLPTSIDLIWHIDYNPAADNYCRPFDAKFILQFLHCRRFLITNIVIIIHRRHTQSGRIVTWNLRCPKLPRNPRIQPRLSTFRWNVPPLWARARKGLLPLRSNPATSPSPDKELPSKDLSRAYSTTVYITTV